MESTAQKVDEKRGAPRIPAEIEIVSQPYCSTGAMRRSPGVLRNYSSGGIYIETPHEYKTGTILVIRPTRSLPSSPVPDGGAGIRTICLAEVKWQQDLSDRHSHCYGAGLRYLD